MDSTNTDSVLPILSPNAVTWSWYVLKSIKVDWSKPLEQRRRQRRSPTSTGGMPGLSQGLPSSPRLMRSRYHRSEYSARSHRLPVESHVCDTLCFCLAFQHASGLQGSATCNAAIDVCSQGLLAFLDLDPFYQTKCWSRLLDKDANKAGSDALLPLCSLLRGVMLRRRKEDVGSQLSALKRCKPTCMGCNWCSLKGMMTSLAEAAKAPYHYLDVHNVVSWRVPLFRWPQLLCKLVAPLLYVACWCSVFPTVSPGCGSSPPAPLPPCCLSSQFCSDRAVF